AFTLPPALAQSQMNRDKEIDGHIRELGSENSSARANAAQALGMMGESAKVAISNLIALLNDRDWGVRSNAAFALGKMGTSAKVAVPDLIPLLQD
uniref:HEAT repeat domain-containing protein n=1 Tax=Chamaesiphon sp. VAR_48_metabat_403 TaxID=2964700 RepID=UPI00286E5C5F